MFRRERQFNIITGEISSNPFAQRSLSCSSQLQNLNKTENLRSKIPPRLGISKDKNQFKYSYFDSKPILEFPLLDQTKEIKRPNEITNKSMLNYVSTQFNIINHKKQIETSKFVDSYQALQKIQKFFKKSPLTEHIHRARKNAPNYHQNYETRAGENQFYKKKELCSSICGIQKTYGPSRYFRKFK